MVDLINIRFKTSGDSLWSNEGPRSVQVTKLTLRVMYVEDYGSESSDQDIPQEQQNQVQQNQEQPNQVRIGELRVKTNIPGYEIYTDSGFIRSLKLFVESIGLDPNGIYYSEQGMQGESFVSCDAEDSFIDSWIGENYPVHYH